MEPAEERLLVTHHVLMGTTNQHQPARSPVPQALQSHFQKGLAGTHDLTGNCSIAPEPLCHCIVTVVNKILQVAMWVSLSTLASSLRSVEALASGVSQGWLCWTHAALTSPLKIQIILSSLHSYSQERVKQLK